MITLSQHCGHLAWFYKKFISSPQWRVYLLTNVNFKPSSKGLVHPFYLSNITYLFILAYRIWYLIHKILIFFVYFSEITSIELWRTNFSKQYVFIKVASWKCGQTSSKILPNELVFRKTPPPATLLNYFTDIFHGFWQQFSIYTLLFQNNYFSWTHFSGCFHFYLYSFY